MVVKLLEGGFGGGRFNIGDKSASFDSAAAETFPEIICKAISDGQYTDEKFYDCDKTALYYKLLPNKSVDTNEAPNKAGMKNNKE
jgi:hypothetical protein